MSKSKVEGKEINTDQIKIKYKKETGAELVAGTSYDVAPYAREDLSIECSCDDIMNSSNSEEVKENIQNMLAALKKNIRSMINILENDDRKI